MSERVKRAWRHELRALQKATLLKKYLIKPTNKMNTPSQYIRVEVFNNDLTLPDIKYLRER